MRKFKLSCDSLQVIVETKVNYMLELIRFTRVKDKYVN